MPLTVGAIALRFACAMMTGIVIGTEREYTHRPAGMRTHMLVAIGSCAVMITNQLIFHQYWLAYGAMSDPARLSAQVIAGVGFLGAGTIMREGFSVKGLTTAASIWAVACLGIAIGAGFYALALIGTFCIFITLTVFEWLQKHLLRIEKSIYSFELCAKDIKQCLEKISYHVRAFGTEMNDIEVETSENQNVIIRFSSKFAGRDIDNKVSDFVAALGMEDSISSVRSTYLKK